MIHLSSQYHNNRLTTFHQEMQHLPLQMRAETTDDAMPFFGHFNSLVVTCQNNLRLDSACCQKCRFV